MTSTIDQLKDDFQIYGIQLDHHDVINKCLELCEQYSLSGEQIAVTWLGFSSTAGLGEISVEGLESLERKEFVKKVNKLKRKADNDFSSPYKSAVQSPQVLYGGDEDILAAYGASPATPKPKDNEFSTPVRPPRAAAKRGTLPISSNLVISSPIALSSPGTPSQKYSSRTNGGTVVSSFGTSMEQQTWKSDVKFELEIVEVCCGGETPLTTPYRHMFEKLRECGELLDDELSYLGEQMMETLQLSEQSHLQEASNLSQWFVGRICCDSVGRLNAASVLLEGNREISRGETVSLDLSELKSYSLFPGQVVAVHGVNATGHRLMAEKIVCGQLLPSVAPSLSIGNTKLNIMIACGPFTTSENLLYEPLDDLIKSVIADPPNVLILLGPILDSNHPSLCDVLLADSMDTIVGRCLDRIALSLENTGVRIMVVSSNKDPTCPLVYPTPPMSVRPSQGIKMLPDPSVLSVNGLTIGLTSTDVLMQISKEEISFPPHSGDRISRLCEHLLLQQSFCPLYPPPEGFCLSLEHADLHTRLPFTPHIFVVPSDLRGFAKDVQGCCVVNPERLAKGKGGGCYARIEVAQKDREPEIRAQILKI